jgi:2-polyprenyl-3-methyl-5-hydroxy-6-metoxy-1,4-benzoquinol methylase
MISNWTKWGEIDPLWAILSDPKKRGNKWDSEEFFDTGRKKVEEDLEWLAQRGLRLHFGKALDFGCGVGRLTRALSSYFTEVHGVDISPSMIDKAKQLCEGRFAGRSRSTL